MIFSKNVKLLEKEIETLFRKIARDILGKAKPTEEETMLALLCFGYGVDACEPIGSKYLESFHLK
jgi:hypothetical protein